MGAISAVALDAALGSQEFFLGLVICLGCCQVNGPAILSIKLGIQIGNNRILGINIHFHGFRCQLPQLPAILFLHDGIAIVGHDTLFQRRCILYPVRHGLHRPYAHCRQQHQHNAKQYFFISGHLPLPLPLLCDA